MHGSLFRYAFLNKLPSCKLTNCADKLQTDKLTNCHAKQLRNAYRQKPLILCTVVSRQSTTVSVVRIRNVQVGAGGEYGFEIRTEQRACHYAEPPAVQGNMLQSNSYDDVESHFMKAALTQSAMLLQSLSALWHLNPALQRPGRWA